MIVSWKLEFTATVTVLTIFMTFNDLRDTSVRNVECFQLRLSIDENDLTILGISSSVDVEYFLE
jgi:hypothetical protein